MRLAKIKNKYMYKTTPDDNGIHYYLIFYNKKEKQYNAIQLTHLYTKDKDRFVQVKKGLIKIEKFKEFDVPSGVRKRLYTKNANGGNICIKNNKMLIKFSHVIYLKNNHKELRIL